jgi:hypothetical protein
MVTLQISNCGDNNVPRFRIDVLQSCKVRHIRPALAQFIGFIKRVTFVILSARQEAAELVLLIGP